MCQLSSMVVAACSSRTMIPNTDPPGLLVFYQNIDFFLLPSINVVEFRTSISPVDRMKKFKGLISFAGFGNFGKIKKTIRLHQAGPFIFYLLKILICMLSTPKGRCKQWACLLSADLSVQQK
ncbi:hypothetical protein ATANTOWER_026990 [Ataeniobius toweri]|uniref:Uncharacterized protein n=1 Tax=Ataeniobius toweri TaxID=208326 RepID=A0ABU7AZU1_9TELE|nr:hypothetical protein [Ataeniobius toweri]